MEYRKMSLVMTKISGKPSLHVLETCPLNSVDCPVNLTICSKQIRDVERITLINGLRGRVGLVDTICRNSHLPPGVTW